VSAIQQILALFLLRRTDSMRYQLAYRASDRNVVVQEYGESIPETYTKISDFYHDGGGADMISSYALSHVLFHEVQEVLYKLGEQNMQAVTITRDTGGGVPAGFIFLTDSDGAILTDDDGAYLMEAA